MSVQRAREIIRAACMPELQQEDDGTYFFVEVPDALLIEAIRCISKGAK